MTKGDGNRQASLYSLGSSFVTKENALLQHSINQPAILIDG
jgi:hypothetical protein